MTNKEKRKQIALEMACLMEVYCETRGISIYELNDPLNTVCMEYTQEMFKDTFSRVFKYGTLLGVGAMLAGPLTKIIGDLISFLIATSTFATKTIADIGKIVGSLAMGVYLIAKNSVIPMITGLVKSIISVFKRSKQAISNTVQGFQEATAPKKKEKSSLAWVLDFFEAFAGLIIKFFEWVGGGGKSVAGKNVTTQLKKYRKESDDNIPNDSEGFMEVEAKNMALKKQALKNFIRANMMTKSLINKSLTKVAKSDPALSPKAQILNRRLSSILDAWVQKMNQQRNKLN